MLLTVLGCSGSLPGPGRPASGYLIEADGARIVVDLGNGTLAALQSRRDPFTLDALLFSHLHADHCADFALLTVLRRYHLDPPYDPRVRRLAVHAPVDAPDRFAGAYAPTVAQADETDLSDVYGFYALGERSTRIGGFTVTAARVDHPCEAYGFRIERDGRTLCYTGDSGPCAALHTLADGVDALLSEASWTDAEDRLPHVHLSGRQAGELAAKAGVGRLLLTHVAPWTDRAALLAEAKAAFTGDVVLVEPGAEYPI